MILGNVRKGWGYMVFEASPSVRYYHVMRRNRQYAVLDLKSMVCEWVGEDDMPMDNDILIGGWNNQPTLDNRLKVEGKDVCWYHSGISSAILDLRGIGFKFEVVDGLKLYCNEFEFGVFAIKAPLLRVVFVCDSGDGIYRVKLRHGTFPCMEQIDIWVDTETSGVLGFTYNDSGYVTVGKSELQQRKFKQLWGRQARGALLGVGRVY